MKDASNSSAVRWSALAGGFGAAVKKPFGTLGTNGKRLIRLVASPEPAQGSSHERVWLVWVILGAISTVAYYLGSDGMGFLLKAIVSGGRNVMVGG